MLNKRELKKILDKEGVHPSYYSLNGLKGGPWNSAFILEKELTNWSVYYFERGDKYDIHYFATEDEADNYILTQLLSDPIHKQYDKNQWKTHDQKKWWE